MKAVNVPGPLPRFNHAELAAGAPGRRFPGMTAPPAPRARTRDADATHPLIARLGFARCPLAWQGEQTALTRLMPPPPPDAGP